MTTEVDEYRRRRTAMVEAAYYRRYSDMIARGIPTSPVPAGPARDKVKALSDLGWSSPALVALAHGQLAPMTFRFIMNDGRATVHRRTARIVAALPHTLAVPARVPDEALVPALGAARRVQALIALGWRNLDFDAAGIEPRNLSRELYKQATAANWRRVDEFFRAHCMTPGPEKKNRTRALTLGYLPPLAWDDIDDPNEHPARPKQSRRCPRNHKYTPGKRECQTCKKIRDNEYRRKAKAA